MQNLWVRQLKSILLFADIQYQLTLFSKYLQLLNNIVPRHHQSEWSRYVFPYPVIWEETIVRRRESVYQIHVILNEVASCAKGIILSTQQPAIKCWYNTSSSQQEAFNAESNLQTKKKRRRLPEPTGSESSCFWARNLEK